jgi:hypothetical protein
MFFGLESTVQWYWLIGLLIFWAGLLFGGFVFGPAGDVERRMPVWTRIPSSATLLLAAISWYIFSRGSDVSNYALFVAIGMAFCFLGDLWMAGLLPGGRNVIGGVASFGVGHIFYITAFLRFSELTGLTDPATRWPALVAFLFLAIIGWFFIVYRGVANPRLVHWIALPYALLLATTAGLATGMALQDGRFIPLGIGATLFLISDIILAGQIFSKLTFPLISDVVWLTYGPAQMLIVYSVGYAWSITLGT